MYLVSCCTLGVASAKKKIPMEIMTEDGNVISDLNEFTDSWKEYFKELLNTSMAIPSTNPEMPDYSHINSTQNKLHQLVINREISIGEIKYALVKAKNGKALGPDLIPVEVLRNDTMVTTMHSLFNQCFKMGQIPAVWRKGTITPIHKSGNLSQPMNYRGITVASAMYKLYCSILNNRISTWVEELGILEDNQNGFRKGRSCQDHLSSITMLIEA